MKTDIETVRRYHLCGSKRCARSHKGELLQLDRRLQQDHRLPDAVLDDELACAAKRYCQQVGVDSGAVTFRCGDVGDVGVKDLYLLGVHGVLGALTKISGLFGSDAFWWEDARVLLALSTVLGARDIPVQRGTVKIISNTT
jgi:hypothetical protein